MAPAADATAKCDNYKDEREERFIFLAFVFLCVFLTSAQCNSSAGERRPRERAET